MELYMDEKWKLSKKASRREQQQQQQQQSLRRSSSMPETLKGVRSSSSSSGGSAKSKQSSCRSFSSRCARLVKEQRAKFYIARRCVTMLICWRDYP